MKLFCRLLGMEIDLGALIEEKVTKKGWTTKQFGDKLGMTYRNAKYLYERKDVNILLLQRISTLLDYDFVKLFSTSTDENISQVQEPPAAYQRQPKDFTTLLFSLSLGGRVKDFEKFPELLAKTRLLAEELGFKVL